MKPASLLALLAIVAAGSYAISQETPRGRVAGAVVGDDGKPAARARVALIPQQPGSTASWYRTRANDSGRWKLVAPTGRYRVLIEREKARAESAVTIGEASTVRMNMALEPPPQIEPQLKTLVVPQVLLRHPPPDPAALRKRTRDIVRARFRLSRELLKIIRENNESGVPLPIVLAQAGAESSFQPRLQGKLDELGLFQLRPATARDHFIGPLRNSSLLDAATSTRLATRHIRHLKSLFKDNRTVLGAYNQGQGRTAREGLYPVAQLYADAIIGAAYHKSFRDRVVQLDPSLARHFRQKP